MKHAIGLGLLPMLAGLCFQVEHAHASTFWSLVNGSVLTSEHGMIGADLIRDQGLVDWITRIPPKQSSWLEVRFRRNERLKGVRFAGGTLEHGISYRIETSIDGLRYQLCQSGQWPDSQRISDLAFNPCDDKALARSLRITLTSSRPSGEVSFNLRNIQVFASD